MVGSVLMLSPPVPPRISVSYENWNVHFHGRLHPCLLTLSTIVCCGRWGTPLLAAYLGLEPRT